MRTSSLLLVLCPLLLACDQQPAAPPPAAQAPAPAAPPAAAPAQAAAPAPAPAAAAPSPTQAAAGAAPAPAAAAAPAAGAAPANHPPTCEVELYGKVTLPPGTKAKGHLAVHFSNGDCMKGDPILSSSAVSDAGTFGAEIFPKWGTDLTICAVLEETPGKPVRYYAKATGTYHAEAMGEVMYRDIAIELKEGPPRKFPTVYNPPPAKAGK